ncbi:hypothetical protein PAECIP111802_02910 [Paenibacillus allorhizosphaerae]|uniref:Uncharacterized protein n=1 Tax=Paenibacillus allorhizosphaerae TaxID=2849866 RepID=A0ABN7TK88_9BACL|nr:hypothetical protein PAECIP111802_02910 [Paenibacillus allorhizosphaerae]
MVIMVIPVIPATIPAVSTGHIRVIMAADTLVKAAKAAGNEVVNEVVNETDKERNKTQEDPLADYAKRVFLMSEAYRPKSKYSFALLYEIA